MLGNDNPTPTKAVNAFAEKTLAFYRANITQLRQEKAQSESVIAEEQVKILAADEGIEYFSKLEQALTGLVPAVTVPLKVPNEVQDDKSSINPNNGIITAQPAKTSERNLTSSIHLSVPKGFFDLESDAYNPGWSMSQKIMYVLGRPEKYNAKTLVGASGIVDAIVTEEPKLGQEYDKATLMLKFAPKVSRMVGRTLFKFNTKGKPSEIHYIRTDWFFDRHGKRVKPKYAEALANLELVAPETTLAPAGAGANAESETNVGEKPSGDAAEKLNGQSYGLLSDSYSH